jgi:HSP20 family protein
MLKIFGLWEEKIELNIHDDTQNDEEDDSAVGVEVWQVALDVLENPREFIIVAPIAWVELSDIDLSLNKNVLTISWNRSKSKEYYIDGTTLRNSECFWGKFVRNIILPESLSLDKIKAYIENGVLTIIIPRSNFSSQNIKIDKVETYN